MLSLSRLSTDPAAGHAWLRQWWVFEWFHSSPSTALHHRQSTQPCHRADAGAPPQPSAHAFSGASVAHDPREERAPRASQYTTTARDLAQAGPPHSRMIQDRCLLEICDYTVLNPTFDSSTSLHTLSLFSVFVQHMCYVVQRASSTIQFDSRVEIAFILALFSLAETINRWRRGGNRSIRTKNPWRPRQASDNGTYWSHHRDWKHNSSIGGRRLHGKLTCEPLHHASPPPPPPPLPPIRLIGEKSNWEKGICLFLDSYEGSEWVVSEILIRFWTLISIRKGRLNRSVVEAGTR